MGQDRTRSHPAPTSRTSPAQAAPPLRPAASSRPWWPVRRAARPSPPRPSGHGTATLPRSNRRAQAAPDAARTPTLGVSTPGPARGPAHCRAINNNHNRKAHLAGNRFRLKQRGANIPTLRPAGRTQTRQAGLGRYSLGDGRGAGEGFTPAFAKIPCFCVFLVCVIYPSPSSPIDKIYCFHSIIWLFESPETSPLPSPLSPKWRFALPNSPSGRLRPGRKNLSSLPGVPDLGRLVGARGRLGGEARRRSCVVLARPGLRRDARSLGSLGIVWGAGPSA